MAHKARKRKRERSMHPSNKYAENPPDFTLLASKYPSFSQHVSYGPDGGARIKWTDYNATRELTRALLNHDYGIEWWIPDGQLCPTVPNRANYIHWIEDLLHSFPAPWHTEKQGTIWGFDIGTGASCIYPLLGAALHGWNFVGTDVTETALEWAARNVNQNPHLGGLISIRSAKSVVGGLDGTTLSELADNGVGNSFQAEYKDQRVLLGVVDATERFDFSMCNPPFFESIEQASGNPHTACGGTMEEMVCPGGEEGFISRMIKDSTQLKEQIHWFTTMVGRKASLKCLMPKLWNMGVRTLRTTEFVQGRTSRWGLAWSFHDVPDSMSQFVLPTNTRSVSFMLQGLSRHSKAFDALQMITCHVKELSVACEVDVASFSVKCTFLQQASSEGNNAGDQRSVLQTSGRVKKPEFSISVFEQAPGALLIKGMLLGDKSCDIAMLSAVMSSSEQYLKEQFGKEEC